MIIYGANINLREITAGDTDYIVSLRNDPELNLFISQVGREEHARWLEKYLANDNDYYFIIERRDGKKAGFIALYEIDEEKRTGMYGRFALEKRYRPLHTAEALFMLLDFGFNRLGLKTIYGEMQGDNRNAVSFARSFGFSLTSIVKKSYYNNKLGRYEDVYHYEMTGESFNRKRERFESLIKLLGDRMASNV